MSGGETTTIERRWALEVALALSFAALAALMLWPLPLHLDDHVVAAKYHWDAFTNTMALGARVRNALGSGPGGPYDSYFFAPIPNTVVFNENLFGISVLYAPFYLASGNPLLAYNAVLLLSLALSSYFTYLFVARLTGSRLAGVLAGVAFPYCPHAFFQMGRIQLVATQWIALTFYFLHRALEQRRLRDLVGLGAAYALQVGTCLYYALFMLPLLGVVSAYLLVRDGRPSRMFVAQAAAVGVATLLLIGAMIGPYFEARRDFVLTRSESFAGNFDGKLSFLGNVGPTNRAYRALRHDPSDADGQAHEEVAFPGITVGLLALLAILWPLAQALRALEPARRRRTALILGAGTVGCIVLATGATLATHSMLAGALVVITGVALWLRRRPARLLPGPVALYLAALVLALALFLGLTAFEHGGAPVRGLYYYMHTYLPGWNGIRKISRQAILTSFLFVVLAGFGVANVLGTLRRPVHRALFVLVCSALTAFEFHEAPVGLRKAPTQDTASAAYRFIAEQPGDAPIALVPAIFGQRVFRGDPGLALQNYLSLFHGRRTVNGKSSFIPPVTWLFMRISNTMPSATATRLLQQLGVQYLVVHAWDMPATRAQPLLQALDADTRNYRVAFRAGKDSVYELLPCTEETCRLATTPELPAGLVAVDSASMHARATCEGDRNVPVSARSPNVRWACPRTPRAGDGFELELSEVRDIAALELRDFRAAQDAPLSYRVEVAEHEDDYRVVAEQREVRLFRDQVFAPKRFVFRVLLPPGTRGRKLRLSILEALPLRSWSLPEPQLFARARTFTPAAP